VPWRLRSHIDGSSIVLEARREVGSWRRDDPVASTALDDPQALRIGQLGSSGDGADREAPGELVRLRLPIRVPARGMSAYVTRGRQRLVIRATTSREAGAGRCDGAAAAGIRVQNFTENPTV
jgi:hypothetical protein